MELTASGHTGINANWSCTRHSGILHPVQGTGPYCGPVCPDIPPVPHRPANPGDRLSESYSRPGYDGQAPISSETASGVSCGHLCDMEQGEMSLPWHMQVSACLCNMPTDAHGSGLCRHAVRLGLQGWGKLPGSGATNTLFAPEALPVTLGRVELGHIRLPRVAFDLCLV